MSASVVGIDVPRLTVGIRALLVAVAMILPHAIPAQSARADTTDSIKTSNGSPLPGAPVSSEIRKGVTATMYVIGGIIRGGTSLSSGISGVSVSADGEGSATTDSSGSYMLGVHSGWSGSVRPAKPGWTFSPANRQFTNVTNHISGANFQGTRTGCAISGLIRTPDGSGVSDVTVSTDRGVPVTTDSFGYYDLAVDGGWYGTVTPSKPGWIFSPPSRSYSYLVSNQDSQNYTGVPEGRSISGYIRTPDGSGVFAVTVSANNDGGSTKTNSDGYYILTVPDRWSGTVAPSKNRYAFSPSSRSYSNVTSDQSDQDYTATPRAPAISGYIRTSDGSGISAVTVSTNNTGGSATTGSSGYYSLIVPDGWSGTVMPLKTGYGFSPFSRDYSNMTSDQSNQDYAGGPSALFYVDAAATGNKDGTSWADAFVYLQDALAKASPGDRIWVAEGLYWPDLGRGKAVGDRAATFQLKSGVAIYGGFPSGGEWPQRNPFVHKSILSGDIGKTGVAGDNSYHVVTASGTDMTAVLDGCVITGGSAGTAKGSPDKGAGLYCVQGSPQVRNCLFVGNSASSQGGGAYLSTSDVTFINCIFSGNAAGDGGALYNDGGTVAVINCTVVANQGFWRASLASATTVTNSIVWGNINGRPNRSSYDDLAQVSGIALPPVVNFSCVQGWKESFGGNGNFDHDPLLARAVGPDGIAGTPDDDLRLQANSPCIDKGDNTAVPPEITTDLEGRPRIVNSIVDVGAHEFGEPAAKP